MKQAGLPFFLKRALDVTVAATGLVLAAPVLAAVAVAVRVTMGAPVVFAQTRPGRGGKPFTIYKFRTMGLATDARGNPLPDDVRLTPTGKLLRATSLDELPQLLNILRGELSLVGPRPLLMRYMSRYSPEQARRHDVIPGITGWAQVNGRNAIGWGEKFRLDVWYVDHWTPLLDLRILAMTAVSVLRREGVAQDGHVTMPEFMGDSALN
ncbi:MAG TPA: sugar transferase [Labilithrix sp.]|nr:sugar transferase [Labilithrix sp.]